MKDQLKNLTDTLKGCRLVRAVPAVTEGVMDLTLEFEQNQADAIEIVKQGLAAAGLGYTEIRLFPAVPRNAVIVSGVAPSEPLKKTSRQEKSR